MDKIESIIETAQSLSKKDRVALIQRLWDMPSVAPPKPFSVAIGNSRKLDNSGHFEFDIKVKNLTTDYYYITSIVVPSANHSGIRFRYFNSARPGETQSFIIDIPYGDDDGIKFKVSGFSVPEGERINPRIIGSCSVDCHGT